MRVGGCACERRTCAYQARSRWCVHDQCWINWTKRDQQVVLSSSLRLEKRSVAVDDGPRECPGGRKAAARYDFKCHFMLNYVLCLRDQCDTRAFGHSNFQ